MKVAIHKDSKNAVHSTNWVFPWEEYCKGNGIDYELVDLLRCDPITVLSDFDVLLWHFGQYNHAEMLEARSILFAAKKMGLQVFPDFNDAWHFDDKVAEMYILKAVEAPIPKSEVYYDKDVLKTDIENGKISFPVVGKLRTGSGSHNVKLLKTKQELLRYASKMFSGGFNPAPSLLYKTTSNIRSSHSKDQFMSKLKRAPEFLRTLAGARHFPHEKDYVYLQQFIPNDGYDMKIVVVGDKCCGFYRPVRTHDFRASGGGEIHYDKDRLTKGIIDSAFRVADALGVQCIGFDYVVNNETGEGVIVEMSYGFLHTAVLNARGYYDRNCKWHNEPFNPPYDILHNILNGNGINNKTVK